MHEEARAGGLSGLGNRGELSVESGYDACKRLMEMENSPTAIVAFSSSELIGCVKYLNEAGYRIGRDVCLFGFDDIGTFPDFGLQLSTIERPMREMGSWHLNCCGNGFITAERTKEAVRSSFRPI